jgi:hypothetical protein
MNPSKTSKINKPNPEQFSDPKVPDNVPYNNDTQLEPTNCIEMLFFTWVNKIVECGSRDPYEVKMLYKVNKRLEWGSEKNQITEYLHTILMKPRIDKKNQKKNDAGTTKSGHK